ncbi:GntR family transcriptional regulator [Kitasatospora sp. NPDC002040]|uniref:GntR family transcriptional regulator n=1 Tax=Kitasatospora sp. NPDC002040 TaxID=3154661 RepID=UPI003322F52F
MPSAERDYLRIADLLRQRIRAGEWQLGERLPSRAKLALEYNVKATKLQKAQELLISEGLLESYAGSGTFLREPPVRRRMYRSLHPELHNPAPFRLDIGEVTEGSGWESQTRSRVRAGERLAARLGIEPGADTVHTTYEFLIGGRPTQLAESWEPMAITGSSRVVFPDLGPYSGQGVVARMAAIGVTVDRVVEHPRPDRATQSQANMLGIPVHDLLTVIERTYYDVNGRAVETADLVIPDSRWEITYELPIGRQQP